MNDSFVTLSKNIKALREAFGLSQKDFSILVNISTSTLINIESGKKSFKYETIKRIAFITLLTIDQLESEAFVVKKTLKEELITLYENDPEKIVLLTSKPSIFYVLKHNIIDGSFLDTPKEINEIRKYLMDLGFHYKGNSLQAALRRIPEIIRYEKHPIKKGTFLYSKFRQK